MIFTSSTSELLTGRTKCLRKKSCCLISRPPAVLPPQEVRDASVAAAKRLNELGVEISMRKDIFDRVVAFRDANGPDFEGLSHEQKRFVEKEVILGKRNGEGGREKKKYNRYLDKGGRSLKKRGGIFSAAPQGLHLDEKTREEVKAVKKKISDLCTTYVSNLNEDTTFLEFTREELAGVPEDLVESFEKVINFFLSDPYCSGNASGYYPFFFFTEA